jgi:hypothetical protein
MSAGSAVHHMKFLKLACSMGVGLAAASMTTTASADGASAGGHIGIATPLVTVSKETTTIGDGFTMLNPIGVTVKPGGKLVVDFEVVVATAISKPGTTGLVVDPGVVYNWGAFATGLRLAFKINNITNVGVIPLINFPLADLGGAGWFIEAAFPTFVQSEEVPPAATAPPGTAPTHKAQGEFNVVLHTGIGF